MKERLHAHIAARWAWGQSTSLPRREFLRADVREQVPHHSGDMQRELMLVRKRRKGADRGRKTRNRKLTPAHSTFLTPPTAFSVERRIAETHELALQIAIIYMLTIPFGQPSHKGCTAKSPVIPPDFYVPNLISRAAHHTLHYPDK